MNYKKSKDQETDLGDKGFEQLTISFCVLTSKITSMLSAASGAVGSDRGLQLYILPGILFTYLRSYRCSIEAK